MLVEIVHKNGKRYTMEVSQVVTATDGGDIFTVAHEHAGILMHVDRDDHDFENTLSRLKIKKLEIEGG